MDLILFMILLLSVAGSAIGSFLGVFRKPSDFFMYNMLSFAAGVMLSISFLELIPESIEFSSIQICAIGLVAGSLVMYSADKLIPHVHPGICSGKGCGRVKKTAIFLLFGIFLHNFPEGMAIAIGSVSGLKISFIIAFAIMLHDIPEAICTSAPYYYCTGKRLKAFLVSFSTAIPTVAGFFFAYFLYQYIHLTFVGFMVAATAGLMIYISADELIPVSNANIKNHSKIFSLILGVVVVILLGLL